MGNIVIVLLACRRKKPTAAEAGWVPNFKEILIVWLLALATCNRHSDYRL